jgi:polysaccharide export outer membrane protein
MQAKSHPGFPIRALAAVAVLLFAGLTVPTAGAQTPPAAEKPAQAAPPAPASQAPNLEAAPPLPAAVVPGESSASYVIGPGDTIQVFVWRNPELSVTVPVRPDGKISTPLVEDMVAVGKTPSELARDTEKVLAEYVRSPQVNIIVTNAQSVFNQVKVLGQVRNPQSLAFREGMTALDAVLAVGGLTEFAAGNRTRLIRKDSQGVEKSTRVRLDDLMKRGRASDNPRLQPGDLLVVPEAMF